MAERRFLSCFFCNTVYCDALCFRCAILNVVCFNLSSLILFAFTMRRTVFVCGGASGR